MDRNLRRGRAWVALAAAALGLAACGQGGDSNAFKASFDKGFNESFNRSVHDSCVTTASSGGASASVVETYCSCLVTELDKVPIDQRMKLNPSSPEFNQA